MGSVATVMVQRGHTLTCFKFPMQRCQDILGDDSLLGMGRDEWLPYCASWKSPSTLAAPPLNFIQGKLVTLHPNYSPASSNSHINVTAIFDLVVSPLVIIKLSCDPCTLCSFLNVPICGFMSNSRDQCPPTYLSPITSLFFSELEHQ